MLGMSRFSNSQRMWKSAFKPKNTISFYRSQPWKQSLTIQYSTVPAYDQTKSNRTTQPRPPAHGKLTHPGRVKSTPKRIQRHAMLHRRHGGGRGERTNERTRRKGTRDETWGRKKVMPCPCSSSSLISCSSSSCSSSSVASNLQHMSISAS